MAKAQGLVSRIVEIVVLAHVLLGFAVTARAQGADDPATLGGGIDVGESGIVADGADATADLGHSAIDALESQAERDLGNVIKVGKKPTIFAAPATAIPRVSVTASAAPTLDASNASIERDIEQLRREASGAE